MKFTVSSNSGWQLIDIKTKYKIVGSFVKDFQGLYTVVVGIDKSYLQPEYRAGIPVKSLVSVDEKQALQPTQNERKPIQVDTERRILSMGFG